MHPNTYLKSFWRMELRPEVFVAMSFDKKYDARFNDVIKPAIEDLTVSVNQLRAYRVDLSKSGESILTDIMDGIAHAQLVLADVSTVGNDKTSGQPYRNGNVMYEVGLALACRHPSEVLLVRDDEDRFLFDVTAIPHKKIDFTDAPQARQVLTELLAERLQERKLIDDARVQIALVGLSDEEMNLLESVKDIPHDQLWGLTNDGTVHFNIMGAIPRLLDKQVIKLHGRFPTGSPAYAFTPLGSQLLQRLMRLPRLPIVLTNGPPATPLSP